MVLCASFFRTPCGAGARFSPRANGRLRGSSTGPLTGAPRPGVLPIIVTSRAAEPSDSALPAPARAGILSADPAKRENEIFVLVYSPIWMIAVGAVMLVRLPRSWGDAEHMLLGAGLALPLWIHALFPRRGSIERGRPLADRHAVRFAIAIAIFTFVQVLLGSNMFFDRLGMEYHFHVSLILNRTPVFLYFLTIAYFSTYYVILPIACRAFASRFPGAPRWASTLVRVAASYAVAFGETFFMAGGALDEFFFYRDRAFMLRTGSLAYGSLFFVTLPFFQRLDEDGPRRPLSAIARDALALNMLGLLVYEAFAFFIRAR